MPGAKPWLASELRRAIELRKEGYTYPAIAKQLEGRSWVAVRCMLRDRNIQTPPRKPQPPADRRIESSRKLAEALKRLMEQMDPRQLAEVLGSARAVTPGTERVHKTSQVERLAA